MSIYDEVNEQLTAAMKGRDRDRATALRGIRAAFIEEMKKDNSSSVADDKAVGILRRLARQRGESIEAFEKGNRADLADKEKAELAIIETFLPKLADEATTRAWVEAAIAETGAAAAGDMGRVMGHLMKTHQGEVDGKLAKEIASKLLG
ncbi:MAG: GatB/YqeY domain-containing protein [Candidatus Eisenbacteria bacterium]|uniref:GatB/YqeY domain-containing protein n=1 Tax=Eiseniibacteriota bacterium TaxID=2212470 RepID=A0A956M2I0_UNCEI|nr:GatB/YqeY domain-containing protein [Candidatus Eisenbacteria bacterium]